MLRRRKPLDLACGSRGEGGWHRYAGRPRPSPSSPGLSAAGGVGAGLVSSTRRIELAGAVVYLLPFPLSTSRQRAVVLVPPEK